MTLHLDLVYELDEPCPFCDKKAAALFKDNKNDFEPYQVVCRFCGMSGPTCDCGETSAVPSWKLIKVDKSNK